MKHPFQDVSAGSSNKRTVLYKVMNMKMKRFTSMLILTLLLIPSFASVYGDSALDVETIGDDFEPGDPVNINGTASANSTVQIIIVYNGTDVLLDTNLTVHQDGNFSITYMLSEEAGSGIYNVSVISSEDETFTLFKVEAEEPEVEDEEPDNETKPEPNAHTKESGTNNGSHKGQNKEKKLKAANNGLNKGNGAVHLYLYQKDPETWNITDGGSWGKLTFLPNKQKFVFNAHRLQADDYYDFINYAPSTNWTEDPYPNPWPGEDSVNITSGKANKGGNVHMRGIWSASYVGKMWLVPSEDFSEGSGMVGWNPTEYLFEYDLID